ncbi:hypothetical protein [Lactococcus cremoris]|uniref:hypothetical protein n=1 Tax=Lactococcus lactis subsp. cremoris TaxID=1359 RepID=UPI000A6E2E74|nr:hypothetical protein [Lactococcus cremoris]
MAATSQRSDCYPSQLFNFISKEWVSSWVINYDLSQNLYQTLTPAKEAKREMLALMSKLTCHKDFTCTGS